MISSAQIRAARAMIGAKQSELARVAGVSLATLNNIERGIGDPRASTLDSIERALLGAGVELDGDGVSEAVQLHKLARPSAYETFYASQRILEAIGKNSLLKVKRILLFARRDHAVSDGAERYKICFFLEGQIRSILFDQVSFTFASGSRAAEVAGLLFACYAFHRDKLYRLDSPIEDTTIAPLEETVQRLLDLPWRNLPHPKPFVDTFDAWDARVASFAERSGHPMADLVRLVGILPDEEKKPAQEQGAADEVPSEQAMEADTVGESEDEAARAPLPDHDGPEPDGPENKEDPIDGQVEQ